MFPVLRCGCLVSIDGVDTPLNTPKIEIFTVNCVLRGGLECFWKMQRILYCVLRFYVRFKNSHKSTSPYALHQPLVQATPLPGRPIPQSRRLATRCHGIAGHRLSGYDARTTSFPVLNIIMVALNMLKYSDFCDGTESIFLDYCDVHAELVVLLQASNFESFK